MLLLVHILPFNLSSVRAQTGRWLLAAEWTVTGSSQFTNHWRQQTIYF